MKSFILIAGAVACALLSVNLPAMAPASGPATQGASTVDQSQPMTIAMSIEGYFPPDKYPTYLSINSAGQADLTLGIYPNPNHAQFLVTPDQLAALRKALADTDFFALQDDYGDNVVDGSTETIAVVLGSKAKTVRLHTLMNGAAQNPEKLKEPARAVRISKLLSELYNDPQGINYGPYDDLILKAVPPH